MPRTKGDKTLMLLGGETPIARAVGLIGRLAVAATAGAAGPVRRLERMRDRWTICADLRPVTTAVRTDPLLG